MAYLDLDELPEALDALPLLVGAPAGARPVPRAPTTSATRRGSLDRVRCATLVARRTGARPAGPVRLLTNLRYFGHGFNPVSFYFCFDAGGERVEAVVAEVTNTPWGERHAYVLGATRRTAPRARRRRSRRSSTSRRFMGMDQRLRLARDRARRALAVHIESRRRDGEHGLRRHAVRCARRELDAAAAAPACSRATRR